MNLPTTPSPETGMVPGPPKVLPVVTIIAIMVCIAVYLCLLAENNYESWETLARYGYLPAESIWGGNYWPLFTTVFVHFGLWHLGFNAYWLWVLGKRLEQTLGSFRFLVLFIVAGWVSSSFQLAFSGSTGIGASGVVYALFGFMWRARHRYPGFSEVLDSRTVQVFILWLIACVVTTYLKIWEVGNAAHVSGLVFGALVAGAFVPGPAPILMRAGLVTLIALSMIPPVWAPWSVPWLCHHAYEAHAAGNLDQALDLYTRVIDAEPRNSWAYLNRSMVYESLGQPDQAGADFETARRLDPDIDSGE